MRVQGGRGRAIALAIRTVAGHALLQDAGERCQRLLLKFGKCFPSAGPRHEKVEVLPEPSLLKREPSRYLKNDPATGKLRWLGPRRKT